MGTPAGIFAFLRKDINECIKDMLDEYGQFLTTPASAEILNTSPTGWLGPQPTEIMVQVAPQMAHLDSNSKTSTSANQT
jgi:phosphatidylserine decarboxylase